VQVGSLSPFVFTATAVFPGPIAFVSNRRTGDMGHDIREMAGDVFVMDEEGSHVIQLTPQDRGIAWLEDPAWAPDGQQVAYAQHPGGARAGPVYLIDSDGTEAIQVGPSGEYLDPSGFPDGERLIVESFTASGLWIIGARNAAEASRLPWQSQWWEPDSWAPDWSPDGTTIVFECGDATRRDVCKIGVDSTGFEHLTSGPADREPKWSPDGSRILFARDSANGGGIWVMNADGSAQVQVITGKASGPNWSPDGTEFVVAITNDLQQDIWRVTVATGDAVNLTKGVGFNRDPDWRW